MLGKHDNCYTMETQLVQVESKSVSVHKWSDLLMSPALVSSCPSFLQEFEKQASRKLRINAKEAMRIAEKLYTSG